MNTLSAINPDEIISILKEENEALRNFRLLLAKQCGEAIKNAMGMLGIEMPERM